jgi:NADPH2:quinone reductase
MDMMRAWVAGSFGKPSEVLAIRDVAKPALDPNDVLVKVEAATININEIDTIYGRYKSLSLDAPFVPGFEALGTVVESGANMSNWVGKRIVGLPRGGCGGYAEYAAVPAVMAFEVPLDMPLADAAGIFMPFHLAWLCLFTRGKLQAGETILIHAAAGGAGSAAVQLAAHAGARVIGTVGSDAKLAACKELGAAVAINYRKTDFVAEVLNATGGKGVDAVFDGIGGETTERSWNCLNFGGRHILFGFSSGIEQVESRPISPRSMIFGNFSMVGALCTYAETEDLMTETGLPYPPVNFNFPSRQMGEEIHASILDLLAAGHVRTVIDRIIPFDELPDALDAFERRETIGRVVMRI